MAQNSEGSSSRNTEILTFQEELTIEDGLILKGTCIVIPEGMREGILKQIHEGHLGFNNVR